MLLSFPEAQRVLSADDWAVGSLNLPELEAESADFHTWGGVCHLERETTLLSPLSHFFLAKSAAAADGSTLDLMSNDGRVWKCYKTAPWQIVPSSYTQNNLLHRSLSGLLELGFMETWRAPGENFQYLSSYLDWPWLVFGLLKGDFVTFKHFLLRIWGWKTNWFKILGLLWKRIFNKEPQTRL